MLNRKRARKGDLMNALGLAPHQADRILLLQLVLIIALICAVLSAMEAQGCYSPDRPARFALGAMS